MIGLLRAVANVIIWKETMGRVEKAMIDSLRPVPFQDRYFKFLSENRCGGQDDCHVKEQGNPATQNEWVSYERQAGSIVMVS